jgi:hypothetical protein
MKLDIVDVVKILVVRVQGREITVYANFLLDSL